MVQSISCSRLKHQPRTSDVTVILVTGATGFIGQHLVQRLLSEGYDVVALIHKKPMSLITHPNLKLIYGDLESGRIETPREATTIIHLAGAFTESRAIQTNVITTLNLLSASTPAKVNKLILSSSYAVYGETPPEGAAESDTPKPITMYGLSKLLAELVVKYYSSNYSIPSAILRLSSVYGPGNTSGVVHDFLTSFKKNASITIHGDGRQVRDFLHVDDAVDGIIRAAEFETQNFQIFNISTGVGTTLLQLADAIKHASKSRTKMTFEAPRKPDVRCLVAKNDRASHLLSFKPRVSLQDGLTRLISSEPTSSRNTSLNSANQGKDRV